MEWIRRDNYDVNNDRFAVPISLGVDGKRWLEHGRGD